MRNDKLIEVELLKDRFGRKKWEIIALEESIVNKRFKPLWIVWDIKKTKEIKENIKEEIKEKTKEDKNIKNKAVLNKNSKNNKTK